MATKKKVNYTPAELAKSIKAKDYSPIYLIYGDDLFTIEKLNELFETSILTEDEREFNQTVLYGSDVKAEDIIVHARRFPMMSEYQVVIVKEVQTMKDFKNMELKVNIATLSKILKFLEDKLKINLNGIESLKDKMNV